MLRYERIGTQLKTGSTTAVVLQLWLEFNTPTLKTVLCLFSVFAALLFVCFFEQVIGNNNALISHIFS